MDGDYVCDCSHYELVIERGDEALILLRSDSPVKGRFTARQEIPLERQLLAFTILLAGLMGVAISIITYRKKKGLILLVNSILIFYAGACCITGKGIQ